MIAAAQQTSDEKCGLVVIHYLNIVDISLFPTEADSPLSVDPNEVITIHIYTYAQMM